MRALSIACIATVTAFACDASATGPREFPDHGGAAFARSGAWLAVGTDPIAAHYNPAAMATARTALSLSLHLPFQKVCYDRRGPGDTLTGPRQGSSESPGTIVYRPVCNRNAGKPGLVPTLSFVWRVTEDLGLGLAVVPPSAYGTSENDWPELTQGYNTATGATVDALPAPYRYMTLGTAATVLFPTLSAGYEVIDGLRIGAGFIWGVATLDSGATAIAFTTPGDIGDHAGDDSRSFISAADFFVPGVVASVHTSPWRFFDASVWYRYLDKVRSSEPEAQIDRPQYDSTLTGAAPICDSREPNDCPAQGIRNPFVGERFEFAFPMELRLGLRFHLPHDDTVIRTITGETPADAGTVVRDPLNDDVFDVELDASWTNSSNASTIEIRFRQGENGEAVESVSPQGLLPPVADRDESYRDTFGLRLGGQFNVIRNKLGLMAGTWLESAANSDEHLTVDPVVALRGGFGGGIVFRQEWLDVHLGYQRHWNAGYDNEGNGANRAAAGVAQVDNPDEGFRVGGPRGDDEFKSFHTINGGRVIQSANVFSGDITIRF